MKKKCLQILCLMLALLLPVTALAEPQSWLRPWINRMDTKSSQAVMTIDINSEAVLSLAEMALDMQRKSFEEMAATAAEMYGEDKEYADFLENYVTASNRYINTQRAAWRTYVPAVAALANSAEIVVRAGENLSCFDFRVNGNSWFTLNLIYRPEEGNVLLTSDLFPACALPLEHSGGMLSALSASGYGEAYENLSAAYQELLRRLPEYEDFDFLGQFYDLLAQGMLQMEAEERAYRNGDALISDYNTTLFGEDASSLVNPGDVLAQMGEMNVDERLSQIVSLLSGFVQTVSESSNFSYDWEVEEPADALPVLGEDATEEEYAAAYDEYFRMMARNKTVKTFVKQHNVMENGEITSETTVTVWTRYDEIKDGADTVEKLKEHYDYLSSYFQEEENTQTIALRVTPTALELRLAFDEGFYTEKMVFHVDASKENEIQFSCASGHSFADDQYETEQTALEMRLTRTDEGQQWTMTQPMTSYLSLGGVQDTEDAGVARFVLSYDNDVSFMDMTLSALGMDLMRVHADSIYSDVPASAPDVSGLTIVSNDDEEAMQALYKNLLAVGVPKLNRLILTGLPEGATALMTPLLSLTSGMAQLGK